MSARIDKSIVLVDSSGNVIDMANPTFTSVTTDDVISDTVTTQDIVADTLIIDDITADDIEVNNDLAVTGDIFCDNIDADSDMSADNITISGLTSTSTLKSGNISGGNYTEIESDGTVVAKGTATTFDDIKFPLTRDKQGQSDKPDFDYTNIGLLFPQNNPAEIVYMIGQMPHSWKIGGEFLPHIHWVQSQSDVPTWKLDYRIYDNGTDPTGSFTTIVANTHYYTYTSGSIMQMSIFPSIDLSSITALSAILEFRLYRDDNVVSGDVLAKEFDVHFEVDTHGSRTLYTK